MNANNLNPQQELAVKSPLNPLLIVAGAGTGKTKTLTSRLVNLLANGIAPSKIYAITFTNKAAKEMLDRVKDSLPKIKYGGSTNGVFPFIGTFHSLGAKILRREARLVNRKPNFTIFDNSDSFRMIKNITKEICGSNVKKGPGFFWDKITKIKNGIIDLESLAKYKDIPIKLIEDIFNLYELRMEKNNAFDFDDLIQKVVLIFKKSPLVLSKYEGKIYHLLIDEYQDLNNMQYELVRLLAKRKSISVVGDDQQTIYSWRGSNFNIFLNFENDWPDANVVLLEQNYRSTANIIKAAQSVISNNKYQKQKQLWTKNEDGSLVKLICAAGDDAEAEIISKKIEAIIEKNREETIGVLYRTNAQSRPIEQAFAKRNIPYRIFGGLKFYERREIKDIIAALRIAQNKDDEISQERIIKTFYKTKFADVYKKMTGNKNSPPVDLINMFLDATDYFNYLEKNFPNPDDRIENIKELIKFAEQNNNLKDMLEQITLLQSNDDISSAKRGKWKNAVELMTIHLSKGLEFDNVFLTGCSEGILPHIRSFNTDIEIEEERRLMYVAMTRAKKNLCISFYGQPSRFLYEIPQELVSFEKDAHNEAAYDGLDRDITID